MDDNLVLNAGCGNDPFGNVRLDLTEDSFTAPSRRTSANIYASIEYLPFRDKVFKHVRCFHTLEHCKNPELALTELRRVGMEVHLKYPVSHKYSYLIELITLLEYTLYIFTKRRPVLYLKAAIQQFKEIIRWRERYGDHKWYISIEGQKLDRKYGVPHEYEVLLTSSERKVQFIPI